MTDVQTPSDPVPEASGRVPRGTLALRLKTRWRDGTTHLPMERSELP